MNRTIKFRGKHKTTGVWIYGDLEHLLNNNIHIFSNRSSHPVTEESVGQFTGLLDRNGKEIYEGDILIYIDNEANEYYREVVYHHGCFKLHNPYDRLPDTPISNHLMNGKLNWEVFGNIHEQSKTKNDGI